MMLYEGATQAQPPDNAGWLFTVTVDGSPALADLHRYVPFCDGRETATFENYGIAVSAAQGLRNALGECEVAVVVTLA